MEKCCIDADDDDDYDDDDDDNNNNNNNNNAVIKRKYNRYMHMHMDISVRNMLSTRFFFSTSHFLGKCCILNV